MLSRFFNLHKEVDVFLKDQNIIIPQLSDDKWIADLAFLLDLCTHLNVLNVKLQGKNKLIVDVAQIIKSFVNKLKLWKNELQVRELSSFCRLKSSIKNNFDLIPKYNNVLDMLLSEFESRFTDIKSIDQDISIVNTPFLVNIEEVPNNLRLEILRLQSNIYLRNCGKTGIELYK